ncbi:MAG: hypothetical protein J1E07_10705 [Treponema sp.]|nr:hypothetical protein [Treponema sp.]
MTKRQIVNLIYLAEKCNGKSTPDIMFAVAGKKVEGKIKQANFLYTIGNEKNIIPISRLWDYLLTLAKGKTKKNYLEELNELIKVHKFPQKYLKYAMYVNPEDGRLYYLRNNKFAWLKVLGVAQ